jgi:CubicO group peptidase (beta-lactamase class C family)
MFSPRQLTTGLAFLVLPFAIAEAQKKPVDRLAPLDAYVAKVMKDWKVPGLAIAIVKNDSVILAKGYGVRTLGDPAPVDANTIFAIGSSSKAFTAALVALAADAGKMRWDEPVSTYLPGLQLYDNYATKDLTVRDALSHRSGLARGDLMWYVAGFPREEILRRVRYLKPSWGFRGLFGYQNIMYLAAGEAVAKAQKSSWDDLVRTQLFVPLGMSNSSTSIRSLEGKPNVSAPHSDIADTVRVIPWKNIDNIAPAGSINSSVNDMTRWLRLQLGKGKLDGKQLISSANLLEMWTPNTHIRLQGPEAKYLAPGANMSSYGLGWFLQDFNGRLAVHHGGNIDGFSAMVAMVPDENLGVVILTNLNGTPAPVAVFPYIFDLYTRDTARDWSAVYKELLGGMQKAAKDAEDAMVKARVSGTSPSLSLPKYAGTYSDSMYGDFVVSEVGGKLRMKFGILEGTAEHWHYDSFRASMDSRNAPVQKVLLTFVIDALGKSSEVKVEGFPEASFRFTPPKADTRAAVVLTRQQLEALTGKFKADAAPIEVEVQLVGSDLKLTVPGQPAYTLVAVSATRFRLTGPEGMPEGFYFEYAMSGGAVTGATLKQPAPRPSLKVTKLK